MVHEDDVDQPMVQECQSLLAGFGEGDLEIVLLQESFQRDTGEPRIIDDERSLEGHGSLRVTRTQR
ncbi:MAG: hypothetical protein P8Y69_16850 [Gammaproteobacteria bacterium]